MTSILNPSRVINDLRELAALTSDEYGAQRVAWTPAWNRARDWYKHKLTELPVDVEQDEAGNLWATLSANGTRASRPYDDPCLILGSHLDSVPNGGWLDGCFGVLAGAHYHFERTGYFVVDPNSKPAKLAFNRAAGLKDTWAKLEKAQ